MRLPKNLLSGTCKPPKVFLCQTDKTIIGGINPVNFNGTFKFNTYHEISFEFDRSYIEYDSGEYKVNPLYDLCEAPRLIYVVGFGYFEIQQSEIQTDFNREYKNVVAYSYEFILSTKYLDLFTINMGTDESIDGVCLYSTADPSKSLIHLALDKTNGAWKPGHVDIELQNLHRSFEIDHESIYDFLINEVSDTFKCVFDFDTETNTVNIYDEEKYGKDTNIYISKDNLSQELTVSYNGDEIKTCLYVYGDSDLTIREVNLGLPYIMDLSYYATPEWMGQDLYEAYKNYCELAASKQEEYSNLMLEWSAIYDQLSNLYNKIPDYDDNYDDSIPTVYSKNSLPVASEKNVYMIYRVVEGDATWYYKCQAERVNNTTTYRWVLDVDNISSFYTFPTPSVEYADLVVKVYNKESTNGVLYYVCKAIESPNQGNNWTTKYGWVLANNSYGINLLKEKEKCYLDIQEVHVSAGYAEKDNENYSRYLENYEKLIDIQKQLKEEEAKATELQSQLDVVTDKMAVITNALKLENNFTPEQIINLNSFIREDEYTDSNFVVTDIDDDKSAMETKKELMEAAKKELRKISQPQLSFSMNMANILAIPAFEPILNDFEVGNCVVVEIRPGYVVKTQILEVNINFDDMSDFSVTFGNLTSLNSQIDIHAALLSQAVTAGKSVAQSGSYWKKGAETANSINKRIERGLIDAVTSIKSSENQAISWDSHGLHLRKYANEEKTEYYDEQIWANNDKLVFTDDNWRTAKMAIGKFNDSELGEVYGIIAPNIVGTLLAGENLVIDSAKPDGTLSSFRVDANGARLYNSQFLMEKQVKKPDGTISSGQIMIDPKYGIVAGSDIYITNSDGTISPSFVNSDGTIQKDGEFPINSNFFLDINDGNAYFKGYVYAQNGYFSGTITSAVVESAEGNFSGNITATSGDIGGWIVKRGILYSTGTGSSEKNFVGLSSKYDFNDNTTNYAIWAGAKDPASAPFWVKRDGSIYAKNGTFAGTLEAAKGTFAGSLSAASGTFSGSLSAATGTFAGDISAATGTFGSQINVGNNFIVDANGNVTINGNINMSDGNITWGDNLPDSGISESEAIDLINEYGADVPNYIHSNYIGRTIIKSPTIKGNNMEVYGAYKVLDASDNTMGYMGAATGMNATGGITTGVALASSATLSGTGENGITYATTGNYVIATSGGCRMQAGNNSIVVTSDSAELNYGNGSYRIRVSNNGCQYYDGSWHNIGSGSGSSIPVWG